MHLIVDPVFVTLLIAGLIAALLLYGHHVQSRDLVIKAAAYHDTITEFLEHHDGDVAITPTAPSEAYRDHLNEVGVVEVFVMPEMFKDRFIYNIFIDFLEHSEVTENFELLENGDILVCRSKEN